MDLKLTLFLFSERKFDAESSGRCGDEHEWREKGCKWAEGTTGGKIWSPFIMIIYYIMPDYT